jgi:hypothetical protein
MNDATAAPDLTPPTKEAKAKTPKEPKAPKAPKAPKDPNAVSAPRGSYGYHLEAKIQVVPDKAVTVKGQRLEWLNRIKAYEGKTVREFRDGNQGVTNGKGTVQTPSGWLRSAVLRGYITLDTSSIPVAAPVVEAPAEVPAAS